MSRELDDALSRLARACETMRLAEPPRPVSPSSDLPRGPVEPGPPPTSNNPNPEQAGLGPAIGADALDSDLTRPAHKPIDLEDPDPGRRDPRTVMRKSEPAQHIGWWDWIANAASDIVHRFRGR
jgi:hypothetical protein